MLLGEYVTAKVGSGGRASHIRGTELRVAGSNQIYLSPSTNLKRERAIFPPTHMAAPAPPQLWATASKEWVIQPKPKPGRKPKKDVAPVQLEEEVSLRGF